jgi:hypothetical protein
MVHPCRDERPERPKRLIAEIEKRSQPFLAIPAIPAKRSPEYGAHVAGNCSFRANGNRLPKQAAMLRLLAFWKMPQPFMER